MKRSSFCILIVFCSTIISPAQDVIVSVTAKCLGVKTPMDTLRIVNLTQPDTLVFTGLPHEITTYDINLSKGLLINGVDDPALTKELSLSVNRPGYHQIKACLPKKEDLVFALYSISGQLILKKSFTFREGCNDVNIRTGKGDLFILSVSTSRVHASFKLTGNPSGDGFFAINLSDEEQTNKLLHKKSGDFLFSPGDWVEFTSFTQGYYSNLAWDQAYNGDSISILISKPCPGAATATDYNGNVYHTVQIGSQCWMRENLRATHYADGTPLVDGTGVGSIYQDYTTKYFFNYNDDPSISSVYGRLYSGAGVMNGAQGIGGDTIRNQGVCPNGWHVASDREWMRLEGFLGMTDTLSVNWRGTNQGDKIREKGMEHWNLAGDKWTNESGFNALGSGGRGSDEVFGGLMNGCDWWVAFSWSNDELMVRSLNSLQGGIQRIVITNDSGHSCRCIKD